LPDWIPGYAVAQQVPQPQLAAEVDQSLTVRHASGHGFDGNDGAAIVHDEVLSQACRHARRDQACREIAAAAGGRVSKRIGLLG